MSQTAAEPAPGNAPLTGLVAGIVLAVVLGIAGKLAADYIGTDLLGLSRSPISPIMLAIVLGIIAANVIEMPEAWRAGFKFCTTRVLQLGIVLLGFRLSLTSAGTIGLQAAPLVIGCVVAALALVSVAGRLMHLPGPLNGLIAVGTSICGCTAIVATAPLIRARDAEISYAIATITVFGLVAMFAYPWLAHWIFEGDARLAGFFLGTSVHETAQVAGAGLIFQQQFDAPEALDVATITKLVRNLCMVILIPLIALRFGAGDGEDRKRWYQLIPLFIIGFALMSAIRTVGDIGPESGGPALGVIAPENWQQATTGITSTAKWLLTVAMAAVGLTTRLSFLKDLGLKPFLLGLTAATAVGGMSLLLIHTFLG
ncbi:MAG: putative sulfate exporter family transporter [Xanthomonadales bacterium]|nr:putative sulfate exporter family transporter [Xanthomonadales bacterium]